MKHSSQLTDQSSCITNNWYAIYVKNRHEKCVQNELQEKGIETSVPMKTVYRQWSDRRQKVEVPLFRGYVFVRIDINKDKLNILQTDGVVKFIGIRSKPSRIPDKEIHWIHMIVEKSLEVRNEKEMPVGKKVHVIAGPFKGIEGTVIRTGNRSRLVVLIDTIMHAVSVDINPNYLEIIKKKIIL